MSTLKNVTRGVKARPHFIGLYGPGGVGKCLGKGTPVMKSDGTTVPVESIVAGDSLMGPNGNPRTVIGTNHGVGQLFRIDCNKGESFVCNDAHLLTVSHTEKHGGKWHEINADEFSRIPDVKRKYYCGVRVGVEFPEATLPLDPYFVGLWIGDGTLRGTSIRLTKPEEEIHAAVCAQAESYGLFGKRYNDGADKCGSSGIIGYERGESTKPLPEKFRSGMEEIGWNGDEKVIPQRYLAASRSQRLELLAGLMDTDGHLVNSCFEFSTKYEGISKAVLWLARSLGLQATSRLKVSTIKELGFSGSYHRIFISGNTSEIPTRIPKKQAAPRKQVKNPGRFGMKSTPIGEGEYFGFEVDGDHRFLLGDFTVTHNSTFASSSPDPVFLGTDDGLGMIDAASFPIPKTWQEVKANINDLLMEDHDFKTLVIDTINGLEPLLWNHIIKEAGVNSIEEVDGGFGKGYVRAMEQWVEFYNTLKKLRNKMHVIILGHAKIKSFEDPYENERFDKFIIKMNVEAAALFLESVDNMFFANYKTTYRKDKGAKKAKAYGEGKRVMFTEERPAFAAKSRFDLPFEMDLSWDAFTEAVSKCVPVAKATPDKLLELFQGMEEEALAYLLNIGWLSEGQALADLPAAKRKPILSRSDDFLKAVREFSPEPETNKETTDEPE